jgi:pimeloyl-ACP methyl ester carboxylesterase
LPVRERTSQSGENPVAYGDPAAERTYSAWLDHLAQRTDVDGSRVGVWGGSFGTYWAARLAHVEAKRIRGAVFHGGNVHYGFQEKWLVPAFTTGGATETTVRSVRQTAVHVTVRGLTFE